MITLTCKRKNELRGNVENRSLQWRKSQKAGISLVFQQRPLFWLLPQRVDWFVLVYEGSEKRSRRSQWDEKICFDKLLPRRPSRMPAAVVATGDPVADWTSSTLYS